MYLICFITIISCLHLLKLLINVMMLKYGYVKKLKCFLTNIMTNIMTNIIEYLNSLDSDVTGINISHRGVTELPDLSRFKK